MSKIIVGSGDFKYEVVGPFGQSSGGIKIGAVSHVSVDSRNNVYFYQRIDPPILVFNDKGKMVDHWGEKYLVDGHGIFITSSDEVFVAARGLHEVFKFDMKGEIILRIGQRENPSWQRPFNHPTDVAVSKGVIYLFQMVMETRVCINFLQVVNIY
jgi:hypothetical protein